MLSLVNIPCPRRDSQRIEIINRNKQAPQISQLIVTSLPGAKRKVPSTLNSERTSLNRGVNKTTNCVQEEWNNLTVDIHLEANMYCGTGAQTSVRAQTTLTTRCSRLKNTLNEAVTVNHRMYFPSLIQHSNHHLHAPCILKSLQF